MDPEHQRARVREICLAFPGVSEEVRDSAGVHSGFVVNGKRFCYFLNNHHGDGIVGANFKGAPGVQAALVDLDPTRFYLPAYMARWGWVGMRLDVEPVDWAQVGQLVNEAFVASAPKSVLKAYEATLRTRTTR